eukprot:5517350-Prymnesium_polylepis.1
MALRARHRCPDRTRAPPLLGILQRARAHAAPRYLHEETARRPARHAAHHLRVGHGRHRPPRAVGAAALLDRIVAEVAVPHPKVAPAAPNSSAHTVWRGRSNVFCAHKARNAGGGQSAKHRRARRRPPRLRHLLPPKTWLDGLESQPHVAAATRRLWLVYSRIARATIR